MWLHWWAATQEAEETVYSYASFTTGANAVGQPDGDNANALQDWTDSYAPFSTFGWEISMGVAGNVVPEPSSFALLLFGSLALVMGTGRK